MADNVLLKLKVVIKNLKSKNIETLINTLSYIKYRYTKEESYVQNFRTYGGLKYILLLIHHTNEDILNASLSILGNCCFIENLSRIEVKERNGIFPLVNLLKSSNGDDIKNRVCRTLANLAHDCSCADIIAHLGTIPLVIQLLKTSTDLNFKQSAIRALHLFGSTPANQEIVLHNEGIKILASHLALESLSIVAGSLKSLNYFIQKFLYKNELNFKKNITNLCIFQLQDYLPDIVKLANHSDIDIQKQALSIIIHLMHEPSIRPALGNAGVVECIIRHICLNQYSQDNLNILNSLLLCCRECSNRIRVREQGGLTILLEALNNKNFQILHDRIVFAIASYLYDEKSLENFLNSGLIPILLKILKDYIDDIKEKHTVSHNFDPVVATALSNTVKKYRRSNSVISCEEISQPKKRIKKKLSFNDTCSLENLSSGEIYRADNPTCLQFKSKESQNSQAALKFSQRSLSSYDWSPLSVGSLSSERSLSSPHYTSSNQNSYFSAQSSLMSGLSSPINTSSHQWSPTSSPDYSSNSHSSFLEFSKENFSNSYAEEWSSEYSEDEESSLKEELPFIIYAETSKNDNHNSTENVTKNETSIDMDLESNTNILQNLTENIDFELMAKDDLELSLVDSHKKSEFFINTPTYSSSYIKIEEKSMVGYILLLLSRFSQMENPTSALMTSSCLQSLLEILSFDPSPNTRIVRIFGRLIRNPLCFESFIKTEFCLLVQEVLDKKMKCEDCRYCEDLKLQCLLMIDSLRVQAESWFGRGSLASLLISGSKEEKESAALTIPYLCKNSYQWKKLLIDQRGLSVLTYLLFTSTEKKKLYLVITSITMLAKEIGINPIQIKLTLPRTLKNCCKYSNTTIPFDLEVLVDYDQKVSVHRSILSSHSELFSAMLTGNFLEASNNEICIPDITKNAFLYIVHYFYECDVKSCPVLEKTNVEILLELLCVTDRFLISDLQTYIADCIIRNFIKKELSFSQIYYMARLHNCSKLAKSVLRHVLIGIKDRAIQCKHILEINAIVNVDDAVMYIQDIFKEQM